MTSQALIEVVPETASGGIGSATAIPYSAPGGGRTARVVAWQRPAPRIPLRQRIAGWRARHWRRLVLGWFVLSLVVVAVAAEPQTDFPKAQAGTVPAVRTVLRVAGGVTAAGVPLVLIVLP